MAHFPPLSIIRITGLHLAYGNLVHDQLPYCGFEESSLLLYLALYRTAR